MLAVPFALTRVPLVDARGETAAVIRAGIVALLRLPVFRRVVLVAALIKRETMAALHETGDDLFNAVFHGGNVGGTVKRKALESASKQLKLLDGSSAQQPADPLPSEGSALSNCATGASEKPNKSGRSGAEHPSTRQNISATDVSGRGKRGGEALAPRRLQLRAGLRKLQEIGHLRRCAVMCAEAVWCDTWQRRHRIGSYALWRNGGYSRCARERAAKRLWYRRHRVNSRWLRGLATNLICSCCGCYRPP